MTHSNALDIKDNNVAIILKNESMLANFICFQRRCMQPRHTRNRMVACRDLRRENQLLRCTRPMPEFADHSLSYPGLEKGLDHLSKEL